MSRVNLEAALDWQRYSARIVSLLTAAAAARYSAERDGIGAIPAFAFWALAYFIVALMRPGLRRGARGAKAVEQGGNIIAAFGLLGFLLKLNTEGLVPALLFMLLAAQGALFLTAERRVHLWYLLAASLAAVLFAAAQSRSALFAPCAVWFTFSALALLALDHGLERAQLVAAMPERAVIAGGGRVFTIVALALALPLYLFVPKPEGLHYGGLVALSDTDYSNDGRGHGAAGEAQPASEASDDDVDIDGVQRDAATGNQIVMYVNTSLPIYLRSRIYDRFDADRWHRSVAPESHRLDNGYYDAELAPSATATTVRQTVDVVADLNDAIAAAPEIRRLRFPAPELRDYLDGTLAALRGVRAGTTYSVESQVETLEDRYFLPQTRLPYADRYLQLPENLSERVRALGAQVAGGMDDPVQKALALESYLRKNYRYTFETVLSSQGVTPLDGFLFETRRGHCEYFASALAVMLRSVGIASRFVNGFSLGEKNPLTGYYEVRVLDGHAWVEAWIPGRGWLMLEPTPFYELPCTRCVHQVASELDRYLDRAALTAEQLTPEAVRTALTTSIRDLWREARHLQQRLAAFLASLGAWWIAILAAIPLVVIAWRLLRLWLEDRAEERRVRALLRAARQGEARARVIAAAEALDLALHRRGAARPEATTFRDYVASLRARSVALPAEFADAFDDARYGERAGPADVSAIGAVVERALRESPRPRVRRQLDAWRELLRSLANFAPRTS